MTKIITDEKIIDEVLTRGVKEVLVKSNLKKRLMSGKKLRIKWGVDPTGSVLHLGHSVVLRKLKDFQDLGHQVIFLIGDFTAKIGDPTGRSDARKPMTDKEIADNMKSYVKQAGLILDISCVEVRYNSEWLKNLSLKELIMLASKITYAQLAQRADFKERIKNDVDLNLQEFLYPMMQGYDSVMLKADVEIGGTDQKFNLLMGRQLQKRCKQEPQDIITCPLLEGLSGNDKMSKSLNNYIALTEKSEEMYGKIMSLTDDLIIRYFTLITNLFPEEISKIKQELDGGKVNPRDIKARLAREIVAFYHGKNKAKKAEQEFNRIFKEKKSPSEIPTFNFKLLTLNLVDLLVKTKLASSNSEAKRLTEQSGVKIDGEKIEDWKKEIKIKDGMIIQVGRRKFAKISNK